MKYFFLISYYNLHFTPFLDELARLPDTEVTVALLDPAESYRPGFGWDADIDKNIYKRVYKEEIALNLAEIRRYDIIGLLGIYGHKELFRVAFMALHFTEASICIFSEGLKPKGGVNRLAKKALIRFLNHRRVTLMAIGIGAAEDYRGLGARRWPVYRFGFTVNRNHNAPVEIVRTYQAPLRCISVGALVERKRVGDLVAAVEILEKAGANIEVDIYGDGSLRPVISEHIINAGLQEIVTLQGVVTHANLFKVLPNYDCLVLCSSYDGWGAVVNEAMQAGLTVILAQGVRAAQLIVPPLTGFLYPTGDVAALALALQKLSEEEEVLLAYRRNALAAIVDYFPEVLAKRFASIMEARNKGGEVPEYATSLNQLF